MHVCRLRVVASASLIASGFSYLTCNTTTFAVVPTQREQSIVSEVLKWHLGQTFLVFRAAKEDTVDMVQMLEESCKSHILSFGNSGLCGGQISYDQITTTSDCFRV